MDLAQSVVLCKFCMNCKSTSSQDSILKLHKGAVMTVQKHMKTCHSKEYQQSLSNLNDSLSNRKQKIFGKCIHKNETKRSCISLNQSGGRPKFWSFIHSTHDHGYLHNDGSMAEMMQTTSSKHALVDGKGLVSR